MFSVVSWLTSFAILTQGVLAGVFIGHENREGWVTAHGVVADVSWVLALATVVVGFRTVRRAQPRLWWAAVALFVLALAQTGVGHLITDEGMDGLVVVHVPLAMAVFGLTAWVSWGAWRHRRGAAASAVEPFPASLPAERVRTR